MNMLLVAPRVRHLDFLLHAAEEWLERLPTDIGMWVELGIGRRLVEWLNTAAEEDSSLLTHAQPMRNRIDSIVGQLRSEEHTSELQSLMRISYAVFCLKKKTHT